MKIGLFSDSHYCYDDIHVGTRRCSLSLDKLRLAYEDFKTRDLDLVLCMGDLCDLNSHGGSNDGRECLLDVMNIINSSNIPFLFAPGNHDFLSLSIDELKTLTNISLPPYVFDTEEIRFICLDANYSSDMTHYSPNGFDWRDANVPKEQLDFLRESLAETDKECIIAIHQPIDTRVEECFRVNNAKEVRDIIENSGKVRIVLQAHMHEFDDFIENGIRYVTVVGMCEGFKNRYMIFEKKGKYTEIALIEKE